MSDYTTLAELRGTLGVLAPYHHFMVSEAGSGVPKTVSGRPGSHTDPTMWCSLDEAISACTNGTRPGFVFTRSCPYAGLDLDAARDPVTGVALPWAEPIIDEATACGCYVEVSKSGCGYHIVGPHRLKAILWRSNAKHIIKIPDAPPMEVNGKAKRPQIEVFLGHAENGKTGGNYLVLTGDIEAEGDMKTSLEPVLDLIMSQYGGQEEETPRSAELREPVDRTDVESALACISPDCDYDQWVAVLMALHSTGEPWALDVADSWSSAGETYKAGEVARKWTSFKPGKTTIATLFWLASTNGWARSTRPGEDARPDDQPFLDPLPLVREETKPEPYPVDALGEVLGEAAKSIHRIVNVPLAIAAQSVLASANLIVQSKANVRIDGRTIPLSLFLLAIALSGERKSEADRIALQPVDTWQKRRYAKYREAMKKYQEEEASRKKGDPLPDTPMPPMVKCEEPTIQGIYKLLSEGYGFCGILSDEGGQLLGGYAMAKDHALETVTRLSKLWDGKPLDRIRGGDFLTLLYDRRLNLHLMMQPGIADKLLCHDEAKSQGFLNRCLICHPESMFGKRPYQEVDPSQDPAIRQYWTQMEGLMNGQPDHDESGGLLFQELPLARDAKHQWIRFHDALDQHVATGGALWPIAGAAAKGAEQALRIAGTLAVFNGVPEIELDRMNCGIELTDFYLSEMLRLHEGASVAKEISEAQKLLDWLRQWTREKGRKVVHLREMYTYGPYSLRTAKQVKPVVAELVGHGYLIPHDPIKIDGRNRRDVWLLWEGRA